MTAAIAQRRSPRAARRPIARAWRPAGGHPARSARGAVLALLVALATWVAAAPAAAAPPAGAARPAAPAGSSATAASSAPAPPALPFNTAAILVEPVTGDVLYAHNIHRHLLIASTTKLMTALLTLERVSLDTVFTAPAYVGDPSESRMGLQPGERIRVRDLLRGLLLPSGNDAAYALALGVAGSEARFVTLMNQRARQLGMRDTHYSNPIGLDAGNHSSAADLMIVAKALRRYPFFRRTVDERTVRLGSGAVPRTLTNRNTLLGRWSAVDGMKTGHTNAAGYVLVGSATLHGTTVIAAALGTRSESARDAATLALLRYGTRSCRLRAVVRRGQALAHPRVKDRGDQTAAVVATRTVRVPVCAGHPARTAVDAPAVLDGPLPAGARAGSASVRINGRTLARVALATAAAVPDAPLSKRILTWLAKPGTLAGVGALLVLLAALAATRRRGRQRREAPA